MRWLVDWNRRRHPDYAHLTEEEHIAEGDKSPGVLMASGYIAGGALAAIVIAILTVIVGAISIATLPVAQFPQIAPPEIRLQATYPGADAQTLEQAVATPIEQQVSGVDNMNYMYSLNATANQQTTLLVDFDRVAEVAGWITPMPGGTASGPFSASSPGVVTSHRASACVSWRAISCGREAGSPHAGNSRSRGQPAIRCFPRAAFYGR